MPPKKKASSSEDDPEGSGPRGAMKIPEFWPQSPSAWFRQVECVLRHNGYTDPVAKFDLIVGNLPTRVVQKVIRIVDSTVSYEEKFDNLKTALMGKFELTKF